MTPVIQIIAPSSGGIELDKVLHAATLFLTKNDFKVLVEENLCATMPIYANLLDVRLKHLKNAILNPEVDVIWALRGGYGAAEIVYDCLDIKPSHKKILVGYSDITVLHQLFNQVYNMPSLHAAVLSGVVGHQSGSAHDIIDVMRGKSTNVTLTALTAAPKVIVGEMAGGNLCVLTTTLGTKLHPYFAGKIVVIEDIDERGYRIIRYLNHLIHAGSFDNVSAIIFGDFINSDENLDYVMHEFIRRYPEVPMFRAQGIGHGEQNTPIAFGANAIIEGNVLSINSPFDLRLS